jgi:hypothetical protein
MPLAKSLVLAGSVALLASAVLAGCASGGSGSATSGSTSTNGPVATQVAKSEPAVDVCALVPADALSAAIGSDPGTGVAAQGKVDGGQCTWKVDATHTALAQYTLQADSYLPASVYPKPKGADSIPGADRGWANAASHTVLVVKGGKGVLFTYIDFGDDGDQAKYTALGTAILGQLS